MKFPRLILALSLLSSPASATMPALAELGPEGGHVGEGIDKLKQDMAGPRQLFKLVEKGEKAKPGGDAPKPGEPAKKNKQLMEIRADQLGKVYLMAAMIERGTAENGVTTNEQWGGAYNYAFYFQKAGERVQLMHKLLETRAQPGTPEARTLEASIQDPLIAGAPIVETDEKTGALLIDPKELFTKDLAGLAERLKASLAKPGAPPPPVQMISGEGFIHSIHTLPKNFDVSVQLSFTRPSERYQVASALTIRVHYSLCALPGDDNGYRPREADRRVGYYATPYDDLSRRELRDRREPRIELIERWNLQKVDPAAPVSDVKNPIVWWIDPSVPHEWREQVRAGILAWNAAFEQAGLRNALVVKDVERDMPAEERASYNPADVSYNVVRWILGQGGAEAPWRKNPFTGEIFSARIRVGDVMGRQSGILDLAAGHHEHNPGCEHSAELRAAAEGLAAAEALGRLTPEQRKQALDQYMVRLIAHEAGHTLGLRHNFRARGTWSTDELGQGDNPVSISFMHYVVPNIAAPGKPQGRFYQQEVGTYDRFAIEYGYKDATPEELKAIAARARNNPLLAYGTDEDANGADPDVQRWVLARDPVDFARRQAALSDEVLKSVARAADAGLEDQVRLRERFGAAVNAYGHAASAVLPLIGGVRTRRDAEGADAAFEGVGAEEQRAALKFLDEKIFKTPSFDAVQPETLQRLARERRYGEPTNPLGLSANAAQTQRRALDHIYSASTLTRLADSTLYARKAMSAGEVMMTVRRSIWSEIEGKTAATYISPMRRALQDEHARRLRSILTDERYPADARSQARADLKAIAANAKRVVSARGMDASTSAHAAAMAALADDALAPASSRAVGR